MTTSFLSWVLLGLFLGTSLSLGFIVSRTIYKRYAKGAMQPKPQVKEWVGLMEDGKVRWVSYEDFKRSKQ